MLNRVASVGAVGWMPSRTAVAPSRPGDALGSGYLSLGAGTRAIMSLGASGYVDTASGSVFMHHLGRIAQDNARLPHAVEVGALGALCRGAGLAVRVIGDEGGSGLRWGGVLFATDPEGRVGHTDAAIEYVASAPHGRRTDINAFVAPPRDALTVWVFGDLLRAEEYGPLCTPPMARSHRDAALRRLAAVIEAQWLPWAIRAQGASSQAWILSPAPAADAHPLDRLTPVALAGMGIRPGEITSPTTRRSGVIANTDVVPTIAMMLRVSPPAAAVGRPARSTEFGPLTTDAWRNMHDRLLKVSVAQNRLGGLVEWRIALLLLMVFTGPATARALRVRRRAPTPLVPSTAPPTVAPPPIPSPRLRGEGQGEGHVPQPDQSSSRFPTPRTPPTNRMPIPHSIAAGATAALCLQGVSGALPPMDVGLGAALLVAVVVGVAALVRFRPALARPLTLTACGVFVAAVALGLLGDQAVPRSAWIGYSVMEAARYYGVGNEMAGALLGACIPLLQPLLHHSRTVAAGLVCIGVAALVAWPAGGANLGAATAFCVVAAAALGVAVRGPARIGVVATLGAGLVCAMMLVILMTDTGPDSTHLGRALGAASGIWAIAVRKAALNVHLLSTSPWALCLAAGIGASIVARSMMTAPQPRTALTLLMAGSAALLVANDSGVVAAGMALAVGVPALVAADSVAEVTSGTTFVGVPAEPAEPQRVANHTD
ncbi:MAG: hypothetical protein FJX72_03800 [Armatimonadetes bacterium]|nr:hypothetical protein [Armatimonadota bacterium]